jgi:hypothetical protein
VIKEELLLELEKLPRYEPAYEEGVDSDCPCCASSTYAYMESAAYGEYLSIDDVRALLNQA